MATLKQLEAENKRLRKMQSKINEIQRNNEARKCLAKQNKTLTNSIKFQKSKSITDKATRIIGTAGIKTGRVGIKAFRGLQRYARFLEAQKQKQEALNRKLKRTKKSKRRK